MKYLLNLSKSKYLGVLLVACVVIATFLHLAYIDFPCLNSDEAAFGYNAYSILKTGKDEYGHVLPTRLTSFGENKLPLMAYLSIPAIGIMGLNQLSTRAVTFVIGIITPLLFFLLSKQLFKRNDISLLAAFLSSVSPAIQILSRHAHEDIVSYVFLMIGSIFFVQFMNNKKILPLILASLSNGLALFSQHIAKPFSVFFILWLCIDWFIHRKKYSVRMVIQYLIIFLIPVFIFLGTELVHPTNRIQNLVFWQDPGFTLRINSLRSQHNIPLLYNKVTYGIYTVATQYIAYFSPNFLVSKGDSNIRFGYPGISPISFIEYLFMLIGICFAIKKKNSSAIALIGMLLTAPLTAALSWQTQSVTRSFFMFVPIILLSAYGFFETLNWSRIKKIKVIVILVSVTILIVSLYTSWHTYFSSYRLDVETSKAWECGYMELGDYLKSNYSKFDRFYITRKNGQPYIYTLFYLSYPPATYQPRAHLSEPDEYGFGQVERFDKFIFKFIKPESDTGAVYIGYPEEFKLFGMQFDAKHMTSISSRGREIYWIYESPKIKERK